LRTPVADLIGNFGVEMQRNNNGTPAELDDDFNEVLIGASGVEVFVGDKGADGTADDVGLQLSGGSVMVLVTPNNTYAFRARGSVTVVNVPELTLTGTFFAEVNTIGAAVSRSLSVGSGTAQVNLLLEVPAGVSRFGGDDVILGTPVAELRGNFAFEQRVNDNGSAGNTGDDFLEVLIGASAVRIFVGDEGTAGTTDDDVGVQVSNAQLALLLRRNSTNSGNEYAFDASGDVALVGIDATGVVFRGSFSAQQNTTGADVNRVVTVGGITRTLNLEAGVARFGATGIELVVAGQTLTGDFAVETIAGNPATVRVTAEKVSLLLGGTPAIAQVSDACQTRALWDP
jgi:hypothetical protein